ncbi:protocadherin-11 X-linked-like [Tubulanus polymorphus]|uniref:protocadherin-11 X-linked-like n=1 Tax=Tubulanus polymorphus TaxID=672921 RepID=UPI003DA6AFB4
MIRDCRFALVVFVLNSICLSLSQNPEVLFRIPEENDPGTFVGEVKSSHKLMEKFNASIRALLRYTILNPNEPGVDSFQIDPTSSAVTTTQVLDRDTLCTKVSTCCDRSGRCSVLLIIGTQPREYFMVLNAKVEIVDINDNAPIFPLSTVNIKMSESTAINSTVLLPAADDIDSGANRIKEYKIESPTHTFGLSTLKYEGEITDLMLVNLRSLDRESMAYYQVKVLATDGGLPTLTGTCTVNIEVTDANDNSPKFAKPVYSLTIPENTPTNTTILQVHAVDPDLGESGKVKYSINIRASDEIKTTFLIEPFSGWIKLMRPLDFEGTKMYKIPIDARDLGMGTLPTRTIVTVHVIDVNDNGPKITMNSFTPNGLVEVSEAAEVGTLVAHIMIKDIDTGRNGEVDCFMDNPFFGLNRMDNGRGRSKEFKIVTSGSLNRETASEYLVTVICQDQGKPMLETRKIFTITVLDANDNVPVFSKDKYFADVYENNPMGLSLLRVHAVDRDDGPGGQIHYKVAADGLSVVTISSEGYVYASTVFDREEQDTITFHIIATDSGENPLSSSAKVVLRIKDRNDNTPEFSRSYHFNITENANVLTRVGRVVAVDRDKGPNGEISYSMAGNELAHIFDVSKRGVITTRARLDREHRSLYHLHVIAKDNGEKQLSSSVPVTIKVIDMNDNAPEFHFPNPSNHTVYISYLEQVGHKITQVTASDIDHGRNAHLLYFIKQGDIRGLFHIDKDSGVITVYRTLSENDAHSYNLKVEVKDRGMPQNSKVNTLTIVVDGTGKPITASGVYIDQQPSNKNLIIVICLATVSGLLAIVLIVAIICIRRKDYDNHTQNVKTETQRIFNNRRLSPNGSSGSPGSKLGDSAKPLHGVKEVSFSVDNDDLSDHNERPFLPVKADHPAWKSTKTFETQLNFSLLNQREGSTHGNSSTFDIRPQTNRILHQRNSSWTKIETLRLPRFGGPVNLI